MRVSLIIPAKKVERRGMNEDDSDLKVDEKDSGDEGLENGSDVIRGDEELNEEGEREEEKREGEKMEWIGVVNNGCLVENTVVVVDDVGSKYTQGSQHYVHGVLSNNLNDESSMVTRSSGEPNMVEMDRVNIGEEDIVVNVCSDGIVMARNVIAASKSEKES
ncbi:hypothetical protein Tco_1047902 [Tanacetum coccineum]